MKERFLRRQVLRAAGLGGAYLAGGRLVMGCGDSDGDEPGSGDAAVERPAANEPDGGPGMDDAGVATWSPPPLDPDQPWWTQGNFAGVSDEVEAFDLSIDGAIPPELDGLYLRNGPNAVDGSAHWFTGHGMLHGVRIQDGKALWFRNRWVQTPSLNAPPSEGISPPTLENNGSNVSVVQHAGRLLSSGEVGLPYEISPDDLSTVGLYDFDGRLTTAFTAHSKVDPRSGELLFFGYGFAPPYLTYHRADASGVLVQSEPLTLPAPSMIHDFLITERHVVFMDVPVIFQLQLALEGRAIPFGWSDDHATRIGVMPRDGSDADMRWFEVDPCFVFHFMNAHEEGNSILFEAARYARWWDRDSESFDEPAYLWRYTVDLDAGRVSAEQLDDRQVEFPQLDHRRVGLPYRYGYTLKIDGGESPDTMGTISSILKLDHQRGESSVHQLDPWVTPGEPYFVAAGPGEDEGYLMTYAHDARRDASDLLILDASDMAAAPIARVQLPQRVPVGFHGIWAPLKS